jgi:hypothetical protein
VFSRAGGVGNDARRCRVARGIGPVIGRTGPYNRSSGSTKKPFEHFLLDVKYVVGKLAANAPMKRSGGITATAVVVFLGSALFIFLGLAFLLLASRWSTDVPGAQLDPRVLRIAGVVLGVTLLGMAAWGITSAVGLLKLREWARISMLVFSALMAFVSIVSALMAVAIPPPQQPGLTSAETRVIFLETGVFYFLLFLLGAFWLYFFCRASVKQQFAAGLQSSLDAPDMQKPISIILIAWFLATTGPTTLFFIPFHLPTMFLGRVLSGVPATILYVVSGLITFVLGLGMLRWKPWARTVAAWYFLFWFVHGMAEVLLPGRQDRQAEFYRQMPLWIPKPSVSPVHLPQWPVLLAAVLFALVPAYFLLSRKEAYLAVARSRARRET